MKTGLLLAWLSTSALLHSQQQGPDIRVELAKIEYRQSRSLDEYISRCQQVRALLPLLDAFHRQSAITIKRLRQEHRDNNDFVKLADFYAALNEKDRAALEPRDEPIVCDVENAKRTAPTVL